MIDSEAMMYKILDFARRAGAFAKANQDKIDFMSSKLKSDHASDVVTDIDFEISNQFRNFIEAEFSDLDYVTVDEESTLGFGVKPMSEIKRHEFAFIIDPIDGTLPYANNLPFYAISIGVFRNQKPFVGVIFAPGLNWLAYSDENKLYTEFDGVKREVPMLTDTAIFFTNISRDGFKENINPMDVYSLDLYSSALSGLLVAVGKVRAWTFGSALWDVAGAANLFARAGVEIFDPKTDKPFDLFDENNYNERLRVKSPKIACLPEYYHDFKRLYKLD